MSVYQEVNFVTTNLLPDGVGPRWGNFSHLAIIHDLQPLTSYPFVRNYSCILMCHQVIALGYFNKFARLGPYFLPTQPHSDRRLTLNWVVVSSELISRSVAYSSNFIANHACLFLGVPYNRRISLASRFRAVS